MGKMKGEKIPPGYKKTEIGIIPEDWELVKIGDVFNFKNGLNKAKEFFGKGTPIVNYMDVYQHPGITKKEIKGKVTVTKDELKAYEVRKGDTFFTRTSETVEEIGIASTIVDEVNDTVFSGFILRARPKSDRLNLNFRKYCFASQIVRKQIISTSSYTTRALTNGRLLSNVYVPAPKTQEEQCAIARVLSDFDRLIESLDRLIEKKKLIKKGAMQLLLTGKKRLPGFKGEWVRKRLGEVLKYEQPAKYIVKNTDYLETGFVPVLTPGKTFILGYTDEKEGIYRDVPVIIFDDFTTASKYVDFPFKVKSSAMKILNLKDENNDLKFIYEKMQLIDYHIGDGDHKRRWIAEFQNIEISLPPTLKEQRAIARILSEMDEEIEALERKKEKYEMLKKGAMQSLLTGKIRLKDHIDEVLA